MEDKQLPRANSVLPNQIAFYNEGFIFNNAHKGPHQPFSFLFSRHHYRIVSFSPWKIRSINHYTTLNFTAFLCCAFRFRSFGILFKWQKFVYRLIMTTRTDCLSMKSCMPWLECYCVTHLILLYLIIWYINYSQVLFGFRLFCVFAISTRLQRD